MKAHRTDGVSLSFGLIFLVVVAWWAMAQVVNLGLPALGWFAAGALILFGAFGLVGALRSGRSSGSPVAAAGDPDLAVGPVSGIPAELHSEIVDELLAGPGALRPGPLTTPPATTHHDLPPQPPRPPA